MNTVRACISIFKIRIAEGLQYRFAGLAGAATSIFWSLIEITVFIVFYQYAVNQNAGFQAGMTLKQVISYSWLKEFFFMLQFMNIDSEILSKIKNGDVGIELCRPISLYTHWFAKSASGKISPALYRGFPVLIVGIIIPFGYGLSAPASISGLLLMLAAGFNAFLLCAAYGMLMCAVRLNITWGEGPTYILMLLSGVLSGGYLPLQLWPDFMQKFLLFQPFAGSLDIPVRMYIGTLNGLEAAFAIFIQIFWIAVFVFAGKWLMSKRLDKIIVQGG